MGQLTPLVNFNRLGGPTAFRAPARVNPGRPPEPTARPGRSDLLVFRKPYLGRPVPLGPEMTLKTTDELSTIEQEIVDHFFIARPTVGTSLGLHQFDGVLPDLSITGTRRWAATARELLTKLRDIRETGLATGRRMDRTILDLLLEGVIFDLEESGDYDRNPMAYLFQPNLTDYLIREYAPVEERLEAICTILTKVPPLLDGAKERLTRALPRPFVTLAIQIASGLPAHFAEADALAEPGSSALRANLHEALEKADAAVMSFARWLKEERLAEAGESFALGRERFQRLLWVREGLTTPFDEVLRRGRADLKQNQDRLNEIARGAGVAADQLIARLNNQHPTTEELIPVARRVSEEIREFVRQRDLVTIPEPAICHVRETPPWARNLWTAAMSPPGPFEKPVDGIYWVTSIDPAWTPTQKEEWMRTFNFAMLKNTTVHEVWPGHYLQALHFRKTEQSLARKVWFSYSFCEGGAHYCEQAALEAGYDGRSIEAEVTQLKDALIRDGRLIVSIEMHTRGMSVADAAQTLRTEAHLEEIHAQREAIRGTYNPEYFCYTLGKLAILDARSKYLATRFHSSLKEFHDAVLASGTPPIGLLDSALSGA